MKSHSKFLTAQGKPVRHLSSKEKEDTSNRRNGPTRWKQLKTIPAKAGMNRFAWDLRYDEPSANAGRLLCMAADRAGRSPCRVTTR